MITEVCGSVSRSLCEAVVNTVNCRGAMGKGIAYEFKILYPPLYYAYSEHCRAGRMLPGGLFEWVTGKRQPRVILNVATKDDWKDNSTYDYVAMCIKNLVEYVVKNEVKSIAIPRLGCGNGGLEWREVRQMIISAEFPDYTDVQITNIARP